MAKQDNQPNRNDDEWREILIKDKRLEKGTQFQCNEWRQCQPEFQIML